LATLLFSNLPPSFKPTAGGEGGHVTKKSGGGNFTLEKIFTSPGPDPTPILPSYGIANSGTDYKRNRDGSQG